MNRRQCPHCNAVLSEDDVEYFAENGFYNCPECERQGCAECMPGGRGCICPECEDGDGEDNDD